MESNRKDVTADSQVARIFEWRRGFNTIHLIDVGIRAGLFRALADTPGSTPQELAAKLGLHAPFVATWCKTAYGMELLDGDHGPRYRLAPFFDNILANPAHPRYLGGYVRLGTEVAAEDFRRCAQALRTGEVRPFQGRGDDFAQAVAESTWGLQVVTVKKILPGLDGLASRLEAGGTVLEVGCGTGNLLVQLAKAFPHARVLGVDIDADSLALARSRIEKAGIAERAQVSQGTAAAAAPSSIDAVVMVEVLHEIAPDLRPRVVDQCALALKPGGWMLIVDETYPSTLEQLRQTEFRFPLMTGFEEMLWGNVLPTREEQEKLLRDAGLTGTIDRTVIGEGFTVLATRKP
ncbi:MAG TPA: class I SAM-dependent methyltransferase [Burkholderiales bacterium]|nr:class I SAM-dependent methyltransferase [Burkholderiales bacterium]